MDAPGVKPRELGMSRFGRYDLLMPMGSGGMASLHLARLLGPASFEKLVAIKRIHGHLTVEKQFVDMFLDEARLSAAIQHPNVVQIFELGEADGSYFIAMEYVHGQDLLALLKAAGNLNQQASFHWSLAVRIVSDAASGLHAAHEQKGVEGHNLGIVHRDVSPANILISYDGFVKMVDFGIAFAAEKISQTGVGKIKGKLAYMSPEQARGEKVDRRTDVFALGIVLFEATTQRPLFRAPSDVEVLKQVIKARIPDPCAINPDLPAELGRIITKALAMEPEARFQTAAELQDALEQLLLTQQVRCSPAQVADLLGVLFGEERAALDRRIRSLLKTSIEEEEEATRISLVRPPMAEEPATAVDQPLAALGGVAPATSETAPGPGALPSPRLGWRSGMVTALLVLIGVLALSSAVYLGLRNTRSTEHQTPSRNTAPVATPADAAVRLATTVEVVVRVTPKEAILRVDGEQREEDQGSYVRRLPFPAGTGTVSLEVTAPGYAKHIRELDPTEHRSIEVYLGKELPPTGMARDR